MLDREPFAGAAEARLDLIGDEYDPVLIANLAKCLHEILWRYIEATLALHRLDDDGRHPRRLNIGLEQTLDSVERILDRDAPVSDRKGHMPDSGWERAELALIGNDLAGHRHGQKCAAVK